MATNQNVYLGLRYELCDLFAGIKWSHFNVDDSPIGPPRCLQNLIMLLQNLPETREVQVLQRQRQNVSFKHQKCQDRTLLLNEVTLFTW